MCQFSIGWPFLQDSFSDLFEPRLVEDSLLRGTVMQSPRILLEILLGTLFGILLGIIVGTLLEILLGTLLEILLGIIVGILLGIIVGIILGMLVGILGDSAMLHPTESQAVN